MSNWMKKQILKAFNWFRFLKISLWPKLKVQAIWNFSYENLIDLDKTTNINQTLNGPDRKISRNEIEYNSGKKCNYVWITSYHLQNDKGKVLN